MLSWAGNLKVGTKLFLAAGLTLAMLLLTGIVSFVAMQTMVGSARSMYEDRVIPLVHLGAITDRAFAIRTDVLMHTVAPAADKPVLSASIDALEQEVQQAVALYEQTELTEQERAALDRFKAEWERYGSARQNVLRTSSDGDAARAQEMAYSGQGGAAFNNAAVALRELVQVKPRGGGGTEHPGRAPGPDQQLGHRPRRRAGVACCADGQPGAGAQHRGAGTHRSRRRRPAGPGRLYDRATACRLPRRTGGDGCFVQQDDCQPAPVGRRRQPLNPGGDAGRRSTLVGLSTACNASGKRSSRPPTAFAAWSSCRVRSVTSAR